MKAMVIESFGGSEQLKLMDVPKPATAPAEVLVKVAYASVNPVDWKIREGYLKDFIPHQFPLIPGWDAAGTVESVGPAAKGFKAGDRVFAYCRKPVVRWGTYAQYVAVEASAAAAMPKNLDFAQAAAIPLVGLTAWQALFDFAELRAGESVLILAGAGGVGSLAIQFARAAGAEVLATASRTKHGYLRELGAQEAIDYALEDPAEAARRVHPQGVDVVLDCVGGDSLVKIFAAAKEGGRLVSIVDEPDQKLAAARKLKSGFVFVAPNGSQLSQIARLIEEGRVRPPHILERPLEAAAAAQDENQARRVTGKVVLKVAS
ncbi:MAG: NADP-dependent oxidoreductase [Elusimicrobia bacterium]|nr:NADP-dependent oxidoreductase [Elusimicrobiota bacterium]